MKAKYVIILIFTILEVSACSKDAKDYRNIDKQLKSVTPVDEDKAYRGKVTPFMYKRTINGSQVMIGRLQSDHKEVNEDKKIALVVYLDERSQQGYVDVQHISKNGVHDSITESRYEVSWKSTAGKKFQLKSTIPDSISIELTQDENPERFTVKVARFLDEAIAPGTIFHSRYERVIE